MESASQAKTANFRVLHTMIRVKNLDKSLDFYTRLLGMKVLRKREGNWTFFAADGLADVERSGRYSAGALVAAGIAPGS